MKATGFEDFEDAGDSGDFRVSTVTSMEMTSNSTFSIIWTRKSQPHGPTYLAELVSLRSVPGMKQCKVNI